MCLERSTQCFVFDLNRKLTVGEVTTTLNTGKSETQGFKHEHVNGFCGFLAERNKLKKT